MASDPAKNSQQPSETPVSDPISDRLKQPLNPRLVALRQGSRGATIPYIKGHTAIDQANEIFGFFGWNYTIVGDVQCISLSLPGEDGQPAIHREVYTATVQVQVGDVRRADVGMVPVNAGGNNPAARLEAHETAYKGAVTDALKRALRSFGPQFANDLYGGNGNGHSNGHSNSNSNSNGSGKPITQERCAAHNRFLARTPDGRLGHPTDDGSWCYQD